MKNRIDWYVYKLGKREKWLGFEIELNQCRNSVHNDFGVEFHQCTRSPKEEIDGFRFCTQHANIIKRHLKLEDKL